MTLLSYGAAGCAEFTVTADGIAGPRPRRHAESKLMINVESESVTVSLWSHCQCGHCGVRVTVDHCGLCATLRLRLWRARSPGWRSWRCRSAAGESVGTLGTVGSGDGHPGQARAALAVTVMTRTPIATVSGRLALPSCSHRT